VGDLHPNRDLYDAAIRHSAVRVVCNRCRRTTIFQTAALWRLFNRNGWNDRFEHVQKRLFCLVCWYHSGVKQRPSMAFCDDPPTDTRFPMPEAHEWKHEARRRR
jgi:hypothetical protein